VSAAAITAPLGANAPHRAYLLVLAALFACVFAASAKGAWYPYDWLLENALVLIALFVCYRIYLRRPLSRISWTLIFLFLCVHELGAHFTYAKVPYDEWSRTIFGSCANDWLGWTRNHFDRLVHFLYGLLLAHPARELLITMGAARKLWSYLLVLELAISTSAVYELFEWLVAEVVAGDLAAAYVGMQGDVWDAQKDIALAMLGALFGLGTSALLRQKPRLPNGQTIHS
jgi:putative membrane protein